MAAARQPKSSSPRPRRPPATSPEAREKQMIALAVDVAEEQMRNGTASAQVVTHYLKLGSTRERLEQERLNREVELLERRAEGMASATRVEELYTAAIEAMAAYSGSRKNEDLDD